MTPFIALCLLITYVVWGTTYLAIRFALTDLPPFLMMGSRFLAAALLLTPIVLLRQRERVSPRQLRNCMLVGAFLLVGGMGMTAVAQQTISSGATTVMIASMPLFSTLWMLLAAAGCAPTKSRPSRWAASASRCCSAARNSRPAPAACWR